MSIIIHFIKRKYSTPIHVVTFELSNIEIFYKFNITLIILFLQMRVLLVGRLGS